MEVQIINFTGMVPWNTSKLLVEEQRFAAYLLAFTKNTRLEMNSAGFAEFLEKGWDFILSELDYMAGTIPSSWEFVDVTFALRGVSRAAQQQITRTRFTPMDSDIFGSYAAQTMRTTEMDPEFYVDPNMDEGLKQYAYQVHHDALLAYKGAISGGMSQEQARGLLPLDTLSNMVVKYNLRQLVELLRGRDSLRAQGEYQTIAAEMKRQVIELWPWSETFFEPKNEKAVRMIEEVAKALKADRNGVISGYAAQLAKAADLVKK